MKTDSKWMPTTVIAVVVTLITAMLEPAAFGKDPEDSAQSKEAVVVNTTPVTLPDRPVFKVVQATVQTQTPASPVRTALPSTPAKPRQSTSKSKKWILIVAAAGAAGATAFLVSKGSQRIIDPPVPPTIVIGTPIVSQP